MTSVRLPSAPANVASAAPDLGAVRAAAQRCGVALYDDAYGAQTRVEAVAPEASAAAPASAPPASAPPASAPPASAPPASAASASAAPASAASVSVPVAASVAAPAVAAPAAASPGIAASLADGALAWLAGQSLLRLTGDDASRFLHSQTTNDVLQQPPDAARWHGYCSPKGRLLATMLAWRDGASIRLLLPDSVAETIRKRLTMFVLRAKVRIANESGAFVVLGLAGARAAEALAQLRLAAPEPMKVAVAEAASEPPALGPDASNMLPLTVVGLPPLPADALSGSPKPSASGEPSSAAREPIPRWLLVVPVDSVERVWTTLRSTLAPIDSASWRWTGIRTGIASVVAATSEQFVPQMLNLEADAIGAVSFTKGCYPGQEVVARSHYLGKTKRRAFLARIAEASDGVPHEPAPGSDIIDASGQPVGIVVAAAPSPDGAIDVLYEAQVAAAQESALTVAGQALRPLALPYPLPTE